MFFAIPEQFVLTTNEFSRLTESAKTLEAPQGTFKEVTDWLRRVSTIVREQVIDFGHGPVTVRQYQHGDLVPLEDRTIIA